MKAVMMWRAVAVNKSTGERQYTGDPTADKKKAEWEAEMESGTVEPVRVLR